MRPRCEMVATLRPGGWFVIDFLNAGAVRRRLVPEESRWSWTAGGAGHRAGLARRPVRLQDHRHAGGRHFTERVRLFGAEEIGGMLERAGVTVRQRFGDYDAARSRGHSPRTILVGQRG